MSCVSAEWDIPPENIKKYENIFETMERFGDKVSGEVMKKFLRDTKLSVETLRMVWDLSDLDQDGCLDRFEFILTMHLICLCLQGQPLPQTLPANLVPPNKRGSASDPLALMPPPSFAFDNSLIQGGPPLSMPEWAATKAERDQYGSLFIQMDKDIDGLVTGADVRDFFINSNLPQAVLARIWDLVDLKHEGVLNQEQFIVAVRLANEQISSGCTRELPVTLPPALIPPSMRPVTLELPHYEESNNLLAQIDKIRRERLEVEANSASLSADSNSHSTEVSKMQVVGATLTQTAKTLATQRTLAESRVRELLDRRTSLQAQMSEAAGKERERRASVEALRNQVLHQQLSDRSQEEEVTQLRNAIAEQKREEAGLLQQVAEKRVRVEAVNKENTSISARNNEEATKLASLEAVREKLLHALGQYAKLLASEEVDAAAEPDDTLIQELINTTANETRSVGSLHSDDFFQLNSRDNLTPLDSTANSNGLMFGSQPRSSGPVDAFASSSFHSGLVAFGSEPFAPTINTAPAQLDPFSTPVQGHYSHSESRFDSQKFDAIFGSIPTDTVAYPFGNSPTSSGNAVGVSNATSRKVPPPRPANQPKVVGNCLDSSPWSSHSPKALEHRGSSGKPSNGKFFGSGNKKAPRRHDQGSGLALSEADQLQWATVESKKEAKLEELLRAQEQADLELAIHLSRMDSHGRGGGV